MRSTTAVVWIDEQHLAGCWIGYGDAAVLDAKDVVRELAGRYDVREVMFDPWRAGRLAQELEQERILVTAFPQTDTRMIPASDRLYRAVVEKRLTVPITRSCASRRRTRSCGTAGVGHASTSRASIYRTTRSSPCALALEALENQPEPVQVIGWL